MKNNFMSAYPGDSDVFGACRPGYESGKQDANAVEEWVAFMKKEGIDAVCCLLDKGQLAAFKAPLLEMYAKAWGAENILSAPIPDFTLVTPELLNQTILPFIESQTSKGKKVVVHCAGGIGRTGQVLTAWLIHRYKIPAEEAVFILQKRGRNPIEAVEHKHATINDFIALMATVK